MVGLMVEEVEHQARKPFAERYALGCAVAEYDIQIIIG